MPLSKSCCKKLQHINIVIAAKNLTEEEMEIAVANSLETKTTGYLNAGNHNSLN